MSLLPSPEPRTTPVWDLFVRLFHWGLAATVGVAAVTGFFGGAGRLQGHLTAGLIAAALVLARMVWGFCGPTHARFADFVPSPAALRAHLRAEDGRHLGHNPLGALMVLAVLAAVLVLAVTGLLMLGGMFRIGPFAAGTSFAAGWGAREWHETLAIGVLGLIALHLGGVAFESRRSRENLARAMLDGRKELRPGDAPAAEIPARPVLAFTLLAGLGAALVAGNAVLAARPVPGQPVAQIDPVTAAECGACHMVYHPSLLPRAGWQALIAGLPSHFGEDASLAPATAREIEGWLTAHAAETTETLPAKLFARTAPEAPFTITATRAWARLHEDLPEALFRTKPVGSRANCAACHPDAVSGRFSPFALSIPKE
ncbi:cytochrome b/b6 domain-containing protein [Rhodobacter lacus]|uniref:Cytochrome b/b6 domain-containing protein n=1 Tax=Rhodobacter lacus TaxID=1641972 RepID=A0ABW5AAF2_9RHOB